MPSRREFLIGGSALAAFLLTGSRLNPSWAQATEPGPTHALTDAFAAMGGQLYTQLSRRANNVVFSPYSIGTAMAMAMSGARGSTEQEIANLLQLRFTRRQTEEASSKVLAVLKSYDPSSGAHFCLAGSRWTGSDCEAPAPADGKCRFPFHLPEDRCASGPTPPGVQLRVANALMLTQHGALVSEEYRALVKYHYEAELFSGATAGDANAWVSKKTNGEIPRILETLDPDSVMVILNAIYFEAAWQLPFSKSKTKEDFFYLSKAESVKTPAMHQTARFGMLSGPGYRALALPYAGSALHMAIVLPDRVEGLPETVQGLGTDGAVKLLAGFQSAPSKKVALALPKFKLSSDIDLLPPFQELGLRVALTDEADFSGITGKEAAVAVIKIGQIRHRALIEVMEEGTKAAAATAVEFWGRSALPREPEPEPFTVDRPFLFFVADFASGAILFQGRVIDPSRQV
jgi:serpin B